MRNALPRLMALPCLAALMLALVPTSLHAMQAANTPPTGPTAPAVQAPADAPGATAAAANANSSPAPTGAQDKATSKPVPLTSRGAITAVWVGLVVLLLIFLVLAARTDILRDAPSVQGKKRFSFSLARTQMAWWFFIVLAAYLYIWVRCGDYSSLNSTALVLLGISSGTGALCYVIDGNKRDKRQSLRQQQQSLTDQSAGLQKQLAVTPAPANVDDLQAQKRDIDTQLAAANKDMAAIASEPDESEGFFYDILRDETGISLHRFQMVVWTVALGVVFVSNVQKAGAMPVFNPELLGLMGISAGTYIGFKIPDPPK